MPTGGKATKVKIYQTNEDKESFGDLTKNLKEIVEFRALHEKVKEIVPLVRARRKEFGEVYPICALPVGKGYLLLAGMSPTQKTDYDLILNAINAFSRWVRKIRS